ncbi:hypothetical protein DSO57_1029322 [Entomophthora muscae]|uniref:Uncharacterized protein n=1 Tax=Entomophthora muscae TaxID=34485 RepID=A0ACC2SDU8_9FUNG|nr:hypothetical protein DSO57_1029322 [Entomophthora muscae]
MMIWAFVGCAILNLVLKGIAINYPREVSRKFAHTATHPNSNQVTPSVVAKTQIGMDSSGDYFNISSTLKKGVYWTGTKLFDEAHTRRSINFRQDVLCFHDGPEYNSFGGCFVKHKESYRIHERPLRSTTDFCSSKGLCRRNTTFVISHNIKYIFEDRYSLRELIKVFRPECPLPIVKGASKNLTIAIIFQGPGKREVLMKPIYCTVTGFFRKMAPFGYADQNHMYITAEFPVVVDNQIDGIYTVVNPEAIA